MLIHIYIYIYMYLWLLLQERGDEGVVLGEVGHVLGGVRFGL